MPKEKQTEFANEYSYDKIAATMANAARRIIAEHRETLNPTALTDDAIAKRIEDVRVCKNRIISACGNDLKTTIIALLDAAKDAINKDVLQNAGRLTQQDVLK